MAKNNEQTLMTRVEFDEPTNFTELLAACKILVGSKILPTGLDTPEKAAVVILTGRELGLRMMASTRSVYVVNGRPSLSAQMMLALAHRTGELENFSVDESGRGETASCTVTVKRRGKEQYSYTFTSDMAKKAGKFANEWLKQPENMCKQRAISGNLRVTFPDAILGMYTPEETESIQQEERPSSIERPRPLPVPVQPPVYVHETVTGVGQENPTTTSSETPADVKPDQGTTETSSKTTPPATSSPSTPTATPRQQAALARLYGAGLADALDKFGVTQASQLTMKKASDMIGAAQKGR